MRRDLRIELRARNNQLWHAIFDLYPSVAEFCRTFNLNQGQVGSLLNLTLHPWCKHSNWQLTVVAQRLVDITGIGADELFPRALYTITTPTAAVETSSERFVSLAAAERIGLPPAQDIALDHQDMRDALSRALHRLTPREEKVIRMQFGLDNDGEEVAVRDIADLIQVTPVRVRQISERALRKLSRAPMVRVFDAR